MKAFDKKHDNESIEFPDQKIIPIPMEREVKKSFIEYSMSVIISRALPDVRDGMKPGQRHVRGRPDPFQALPQVGNHRR